MVAIANVWATHIQPIVHIADNDYIDLDNGNDGLTVSIKRLARDYVEKNAENLRVTTNHRIAIVLNPQTKSLKRVDKTERDQNYSEINKMIAGKSTHLHIIDVLTWKIHRFRKWWW